MPTAKKDHGLIVVEAKKPLRFEVRQCNIDAGKAGSKNQCVLADALADTFGEMVLGFEVGTAVTKIYAAGQVTKYRTPKVLRTQIVKFDTTGRWDLPPGRYQLEPFAPPKRKTGRHDLKNPKRGGKGHTPRAMPTRQVTY